MSNFKQLAREYVRKYAVDPVGEVGGTSYGEFDPEQLGEDKPLKQQKQPRKIFFDNKTIEEADANGFIKYNGKQVHPYIVYKEILPKYKEFIEALIVYDKEVNKAKPENQRLEDAEIESLYKGNKWAAFKKGLRVEKIPSLTTEIIFELLFDSDKSEYDRFVRSVFDKMVADFGSDEIDSFRNLYKMTPAFAFIWLKIFGVKNPDDKHIAEYIEKNLNKHPLDIYEQGIYSYYYNQESVKGIDNDSKKTKQPKQPKQTMTTPKQKVQDYIDDIIGEDTHVKSDVIRELLKDPKVKSQIKFTQ